MKNSREKRVCMKPCPALQPLGCGAALQLRAVVPSPAAPWAQLCPAAPLLPLPDYSCCCSRGESCWLLWSYRCQEACQDKVHACLRLCRVLLLMAGTQRTRSPKWAARRWRARAKQQSGADKMLPSFLLSAHNLCVKCQRGNFPCGKLM